MRVSEIITESVNKKPWTFYHGTKSDTFDHFAPQSATKGEQYWNPLGNGMYATNNIRFAAGFGHNVHKVIIPAGSSYKRINMAGWQSTGFGLVIRALRKSFKAAGESYDAWEHGVRAPLPDVKKMPREQLIDALVKEYPDKEAEEIRKLCTPHDDAALRGFLNVRYKNRPYVRDDKKSKAISAFRVGLFRTLRSNDPYTGLYESSHLVDIFFGEKIMEVYYKVLPAESDRTFGKYDFVVFSETNDPIGFADEEVSCEVVIFNKALQKTVPNDIQSKFRYL